MKKILSLLVIALAFSAHAAEQKKETEKNISLNVPQDIAALTYNSKDADLKKISDWLDASPNNIDRRIHGLTLLEQAAQNINIKLVRLLIDKGAQVPKDIMYYAVRGFPSTPRIPRDDANIYSLLQLLMNNGGDINAKATEKGITPLMRILENVRSMRTQQMVTTQNSKKVNSLVDFLLEKGADPEAVDSKGKSVMWYAKATGVNYFVHVIEKAIKLKHGEERSACN